MFALNRKSLKKRKEKKEKRTDESYYGKGLTLRVAHTEVYVIGLNQTDV